MTAAGAVTEMTVSGARAAGLAHMGSTEPATHLTAGYRLPAPKRRSYPALRRGR